MVFTGKQFPDPNLGGTYYEAVIDKGQKASVFFSAEVLHDAAAYDVSREALAEFCKEDGHVDKGVLQIRITTADLDRYRQAMGQ